MSRRNNDELEFSKFMDDRAERIERHPEYYAAVPPRDNDYAAFGGKENYERERSKALAHWIRRNSSDPHAYNVARMYMDRGLVSPDIVVAKGTIQ